jgi:hypothetical protein
MNTNTNTKTKTKTNTNTNEKWNIVKWALLSERSKSIS